MGSETNGPERRYVGFLTDNRIWNRFGLRDDDVFVTTPAKCGTTWLITLVMALIEGRPRSDGHLQGMPTWVDACFRDTAPLLAALEATEQRRCLKTHTPLDGLPWSKGLTYFAIYRHPLDAYFSMGSHIANLARDLPLKKRYPADPDRAFDMFLEDRPVDYGTDEHTLSCIVHHFRTVAQAASSPNVHLFHYADLKRDAVGQTKRLSRALGLEHPDELIEATVDAASFKSMRSAAANVDSDGTGGGTFRSEAGFFAEGTSNKWSGKLTEAQLNAYNARMLEMLPPNDIAWLERGGGEKPSAGSVASK